MCPPTGLPRMPLYRIDDKIVHFIHIPKTAGSSTSQVLRRLSSSWAFAHRSNLGFANCTPQHMHAAIHSVFLPEEFCDYSFAITRHPIERIKSEYLMRSTGPAAKMSFDSFVSDAFRRYRSNPYLYDNHIRPQAEFVTMNTNVFAIEDGLQEILASVFSAIGKPRRFSRAPRRRTSDRCEITMSTKTEDKIRAFYAVDFERFGYE